MKLLNIKLLNIKLLNIILILSLLVFVVTGCQKQASTPNIPVNQGPPAGNTPGAVQTQTPQASGPDLTAEDNVTVGNNPDTGNVIAPDVDTSSLS